MKPGFRAVFLSVLLLSQSLSSFAIEIETKTMADFKAKVLEMAQKHGADKVVAVFDIDNTLLAMNQDLGSDQWFSWQEELKENDKLRVSDNFAGLLSAQGILFSLSHMKTPEKHTSTMVKEIQSQGVKSFVLTSRGPEFRSVTERELKRNDLDFSESAIGPKGGIASKFSPYEGLEHIFSEEQAKLFKISSPRNISYQDGVIMSAGQHKGAILKAILAKFDFRPKAIVFIDDHKKHTERVDATFNNSGIEVFAFRYGAWDAEVEKFKKSDKKKVSGDWQKIKKLREEIFVGI